jgi:hypothetical protein
MAKKGLGVIRTNVSIPADLKRRMEKAKEPVNWSALAAEAFERKLSELEIKKENPVMAGVIERLRASKQEAESQEYKTGWDAGKKWAEKYAEVPELRRLETWLDDSDIEQGGRYDLVFPEINAFDAAEHLAFAIRPDDQSRSGAKEFWENAVDEALRDEIAQPECLRGFVEGAIDVWNKVKDQL